MLIESAVREAQQRLEEAGLKGSILVRDLGSGRELGIEPDLQFPLASLVKVPLAAVVLELINSGQVDGSQTIMFRPDEKVPGPTGLCQFNHPAAIAVGDLLYLSLAISDDTAADALFKLCPPAQVTKKLRALGLMDVTARHTIGELYRTLADRLDPSDLHLAQSLAIQAGTDGRGHLIPQLDVTRANAGSARGMIELLQEIWTGTRMSSETCRTMQALLSRNVFRNRLTPDFSSDASAWASKTGTFLNLRHEVGIVQHNDGAQFAIAALTESSVAATIQPVAEQTIGFVARQLHDALRATQPN